MFLKRKCFGHHNGGSQVKKSLKIPSEDDAKGLYANFIHNRVELSTKTVDLKMEGFVEMLLYICQPKPNQQAEARDLEHRLNAGYTDAYTHYVRVRSLVYIIYERRMSRI